MFGCVLAYLCVCVCVCKPHFYALASVLHKERNIVLVIANVLVLCSESSRGNQIRGMDVFFSAYLRVEGVSEDLTQLLSVHLRFPRLSGVQHRGFNSP